jgi:DNA-binding NarL/FixJ family response regulator
LNPWRHLETASDRSHRARNGRGEFRRDVAKVERDAEACRLYSQGWTLTQIADHLGYSHRSNVKVAIDNLLLEIARTGGAEELRVKQLAEMAELQDS